MLIVSATESQLVLQFMSVWLRLGPCAGHAKLGLALERHTSWLLWLQSLWAHEADRMGGGAAVQTASPLAPLKKPRVTLAAQKQLWWMGEEGWLFLQPTHSQKQTSPEHLCNLTIWIKYWEWSKPTRGGVGMVLWQTFLCQKVTQESALILISSC